MGKETKISLTLAAVSECHDSVLRILLVARKIMHVVYQIRTLS